MSVSDGDNAQDKQLAQHEVRINMLEKNVSTLSQATVSLTATAAEHSTQIVHLVEVSRNTLAGVQEQGKTLAGITSDISWVKRVGWAVISVLLGAGGWYLRKLIGG